MKLHHIYSIRFFIYEKIYVSKSVTFGPSHKTAFFLLCVHDMPFIRSLWLGHCPRSFSLLTYVFPCFDCLSKWRSLFWAGSILCLLLQTLLHVAAILVVPGHVEPSPFWCDELQYPWLSCMTVSPPDRHVSCVFCLQGPEQFCRTEVCLFSLHGYIVFYSLKKMRTYETLKIGGKLK